MDAKYQKAIKFKESGNYNEYFKIIVVLTEAGYKKAETAFDEAWDTNLDLKQTYTPELLSFYKKIKDDSDPESSATYNWAVINI